MKIVVCMKETLDTTKEKRFGPDMRLERPKENAIINPFDEYTIEEGLRQQEKHGGEVIVLCMGPATATDTIRRALAMGADRGVLVTDPALGGSDAVGTARVLAAALTRIGYDLAIFGSAAADAYGGVVPAAVAELLGAPLLSWAGKLDVDGGTARIQRQADIGTQTAEAPLPALVSVVKAINDPRYPSMKGIMQSKKKPVDTMTLADLGLAAGQAGADGAGERVLGATPVSMQRKGEMYLGNEGAAQRILDFLIEQKVL